VMSAIDNAITIRANPFEVTEGLPIKVVLSVSR